MLKKIRKGGIPPFQWLMGSKKEKMILWSYGIEVKDKHWGGRTIKRGNINWKLQKTEGGGEIVGLI